MSDDRDQKPSDDREQEPSENREQDSSEDQERDSSEDQERDSSEDQERDSSDDREQDSSDDREQDSSDDREQDSSDDDHGEDSSDDREQDASDGGSKRRTAAWAIAAVRSQFTDLSGRALEQITGVDKGDDSTWTVGVEVVEIRMVPDTADILAQYDVKVDQDGDIIGYRRVRRYLRGRADD